MHEPAVATAPQTAIAFARLSGAVDALSSAIAGFALLAGARAFMFIALLGWREPVLGGAGLVLLALVGWLRWQCGGAAICQRCATSGRRPAAATQRAAAANFPRQMHATLLATIVRWNVMRSAQTLSSSRAPAASARLERGRERNASRHPITNVQTPAVSRQPDHKETPC
jgi:hypothetical protein